MEEKVIFRRKMIILICGVVLFFFTSMSKMLIPGAVFADLQKDLHFSAAELGAIGAAFMYAYAFSQLAIGIFSDRYGGVRLLVLGCGAFTLGTFLSVMVSSPVLMGIFRVLTALGAGVTFLGVAKLASDLFPTSFSFALGTVLLIGYLGPVCGIAPMVYLISKTSWRIALGIPGVICFLAFIIILLNMRGTLRPVQKGQTFTPLFTVLRSKEMWYLFGCSAVVFGGYYAMLTLFGMKCLTDIVHLKTGVASLIISGFATMVAAEALLLNFLMMLVRNRRRVMVFASSISFLTGSCLGWAVLQFDLPRLLLVPALLLFTFPAGFFAIYSTVAKEIVQGECVGVAIAILNFFAFIAIAASGQITAWLLQYWEAASPMGETGILYPVAAYRNIFIFLTIIAVLGLLSAFGVPETKDKNAVPQQGNVKGNMKK